MCQKAPADTRSYDARSKSVNSRWRPTARTSFITGSEHRTLRCDSHHRQAIASRRSASGSAEFQPPPHPVQEVQAPPASFRKLPTFDQSVLAQVLQGLGNLGLGVPSGR